MSCSASGSTRMLFQSGSRMTFMLANCGNRKSEMGNGRLEGISRRPFPISHFPFPPLGLRTSLYHRLGGVRSKLLEILPEHLGELLRLRIVRGLVLPRIAWPQDLGRHVLDLARNRQ